MIQRVMKLFGLFEEKQLLGQKTSNNANPYESMSLWRSFCTLDDTYVIELLDKITNREMTLDQATAVSLLWYYLVLVKESQSCTPEKKVTTSSRGATQGRLGSLSSCNELETRNLHIHIQQAVSRWDHY